MRIPARELLLGMALLSPIGAMAQSADPAWVPGSSQKVCQLVGELDHETGQPAASQTETNYGLTGNDLGSSFLHAGELWFLFGDSHPTATFNGKPNAQSDPPRTPSDNDAIGAGSTGVAVILCFRWRARRRHAPEWEPSGPGQPISRIDYTRQAR